MHDAIFEVSETNLFVKGIEIINTKNIGLLRSSDAKQYKKSNSYILDPGSTL